MFENFRQAIGLLGDVAGLAADEASAKFQALSDALLRCGRALLIAGGVLLIGQVATSYLGPPWLAEVFFFFLGALAIGVTFVALEIVSLAYTLGERFAIVRRTFERIAYSCALLFFVLLWWYKLPKSFVILAVLIGLLVVVRISALPRRVRPNLARMKGLVTTSLVVLLIQSWLVIQFPQTASLINLRIAGLDRLASGTLVSKPVRKAYASMADLEAIVDWYDERGPLVYYWSARPPGEWSTEEDLPELWDGQLGTPTHPTTGAALSPVEEPVRTRLFALMRQVERQRSEAAEAERQRAAEEQRARDADAEAERQRAAEEQRARDADAEAERQRAAEEQRARDADAEAERQRAAEEQRARDADAEAARRRAAQERQARAAAEFDALIDDGAVGWQPPAQLAQFVQGRKILVSYSAQTRSAAAKIIARLRALGASVDHREDPAANVMEIFYPQRELDAAQTAQSVISDLVRVRITADNRRAQVEIHIR